jgi:hypothetical protein
MKCLKLAHLRSRSHPRGRKELNPENPTMPKAKAVQSNVGAEEFSLEKSFLDQRPRRTPTPFRQRLRRLRELPSVMERKEERLHPHQSL